MLDVEVIRARRRIIKDQAECDGCGTTLVACKAERGKDPTAPPWFGCCARGLSLDIPCRHQVDTAALNRLLDEIESGTVRDEAEVLLDSLTEATSRRDLLRRLAGVQ